jgi:hypothetical protein
VCVVGTVEYFRFNKVFSPAHCRGGYYFFLDKKVAKNQDGKNLLPTKPTPGPVFRQAFARFGVHPLNHGSDNYHANPLIPQIMVQTYHLLHLFACISFGSAICFFSGVGFGAVLCFFG